MTLIDTHTHLYLPEFESDREEVITRSMASGVGKMLLPNIDTGSWKGMMDIAGRYPGVCFPMIGLHPTSVRPGFEEELTAVFSKVAENSYVAVGETGIDLYWDKTHLQEQIISFRRHIELALDLSLPLVIHARDSFGVIFDILSDYSHSGLTGVFHAFTGTAADVNRVLDFGFMLGIGGIVTFKNSGLANVITEAGLSSVILETDSPYLAPAPYRGKRNESSYLTIINEKVASIFGVSPEESAEITSANATRLFKLNNLAS